MATTGIFSGPAKCILIAVSSITLAGCFDNDGGTAAKAKYEKALRNSKTEEKGIPIPDAGHTFVLLAFAAGVIFLRLPRRL